MGIFQALREHQIEVVDAWVHELLHDKSSQYANESEANLRPLVNQAAEAFGLVLDGGDWEDLDAFITLIARKRLSQGFKLSEVQKAFMLYQQLVTPILIREVREEELVDALFRLDNCISKTIVRFSDFFQGLHEEFIRQREAVTFKALAQQAASLAHDIRNPLTAIKMNVQMLAAELNDNPTHHRLIAISQKEVASIERSVEEMMNLARPFRLNREMVLLRPFILDCVESLRSRMAHKNVSASVRLGADLEQLRMDPHRMEQTLVNLLFNAIEAVSRGGRIYVSSGRTEFQGRHWGMITVADDGPGIPKELLPYVFDEKRSRRIGLGLDNVKKIVEAHGGVVEVSLRRPRGLRVTLRLPLEQ